MAGTPNELNKDNYLVMEAASCGMGEVELGKIAGTNAFSSDVKMFGKQLVTDHSKANDDFKLLAAKKNITLPTISKRKILGAYKRNETEKRGQF